MAHPSLALDCGSSPADRQHALQEGLDARLAALALRLRAVRNARQAEARVEAMAQLLAHLGRRAQADPVGDRELLAVGEPVATQQRQVRGLSGAELEVQGAGLALGAVGRVHAAREEDHGPRVDVDQPLLLGREDVHAASTHGLVQDVMARIGVKARHAARTGQVEVGAHVAELRVARSEQLHQQCPVVVDPAARRRAEALEVADAHDERARVQPVEELGNALRLGFVRHAVARLSPGAPELEHLRRCRFEQDGQPVAIDGQPRSDWPALECVPFATPSAPELGGSVEDLHRRLRSSARIVRLPLPTWIQATEARWGRNPPWRISSGTRWRALGRRCSPRPSACCCGARDLS
jgi:hypothetical protein